MKKITINLSFYNQDEALRRHVLEWKSYPAEIKNKFTFLIVDDCSKNEATEVLSDINLDDLDVQIYRVAEDVPWNQAGAVNLGMQECQTEWGASP